MYKVTKKQTRPSRDVAFWANQGILADTFGYISAVHQANIIESEITISDESLVLTKIMIWSNKEAYDRFMNDQKVIDELITPGHAYMDENGITRHPDVGEEIPD